MRYKWMIAASAVVVIAGSLVVARATTNTKVKDQESPFRLGKAQAEELQVSVREVGVVDPVSRWTSSPTVSGRVLGIRVREGDRVQDRRRAGRGRARRQPGAVALRRQVGGQPGRPAPARRRARARPPRRRSSTPA